MLKLVYQHDNVTWKEINYELERSSSSADLLTHATFGEHDNTLLLATHDRSKRLRLYNVKIDWHPMQTLRPNAPPMISAVTPTLDVGHLAVEDNIQPAVNNDAFQTEQYFEAPPLCHLQIMPAVLDITDPAVETLPTVMAVFTHVQNVHDMQQQRETFTAIALWEIRQIAPVLHESFAKLKQRKEPTPALSAVTRLKRQSDIFTATAILSIELQNLNTLLLLINSDGSLDVRDRATMMTIHSDGMTNYISSLPQAGFVHPVGDHKIHAALSADGSALVYMQDGPKLHLQPITLGWTWDGKRNLDDPIIETAVVAAARQYSIACCSSHCSDEVLAILPPDLDRTYRRLFVSYCILFMNRNPDLSQEPAQRQQNIVIRDSLLPRALSAQLILGYGEKVALRDISGKIAWAMLNCKLICTSVVQSVSNSKDVFRPGKSTGFK